MCVCVCVSVVCRWVCVVYVIEYSCCTLCSLILVLEPVQSLSLTYTMINDWWTLPIEFQFCFAQNSPSYVRIQTKLSVLERLVVFYLWLYRIGIRTGIMDIFHLHEDHTNYAWKYSFSVMRINNVMILIYFYRLRFSIMNVDFLLIYIKEFLVYQYQDIISYYILEQWQMANINIVNSSAVVMDAWTITLPHLRLKPIR